MTETKEECSLFQRAQRKAWVKKKKKSSNVEEKTTTLCDFACYKMKENVWVAQKGITTSTVLHRCSSSIADSARARKKERKKKWKSSWCLPLFSNCRQLSLDLKFYFDFCFPWGRKKKRAAVSKNRLSVEDDLNLVRWNDKLTHIRTRPLLFSVHPVDNTTTKKMLGGTHVYVDHDPKMQIILLVRQV